MPPSSYRPRNRTYSAESDDAEYRDGNECGGAENPGGGLQRESVRVVVHVSPESTKRYVAPELCTPAGVDQTVIDGWQIFQAWKYGCFIVTLDDAAWNILDFEDSVADK